jgi:hypothetical protein
MVNRREYSEFLLMCYLKLPWAWRLIGKQFLLVARRALV